MPVQFKDIVNYTVYSTDAKAGRIKDILFDDLTFAVRYFVVDTSDWLPEIKVLLTTDSLLTIDPSTKNVYFNLSEKKIKDAPPIEMDLPASMQHGKSLQKYWGWSSYQTATPWTATWFPYPGYVLPDYRQRPHTEAFPKEWADIIEARKQNFDSHLRSAAEITGYKIDSSDHKKFGEVADILFDDDVCILIDLVLASRKWLPGGKEFTCSPFFIREINALDQTVGIALTKSILMNSPEFNFENYGEDFRQSLVEYYLMPQSDHFQSTLGTETKRNVRF